MKLIASGVANCAASVRSPSFSRSSSSQTTTIRPGADLLQRLLDGRERPAHRDELLHVLGEHVHLQVHGPAGLGRRRASCARASRGSATRRTSRRRSPTPSATRRRPRSSPSRPCSAAVRAGRRTSRPARSRPSRVSRTTATPSTWPCTTWPPSRSDARSGSSRFTVEPAATSASEERRSDSCMTSALNAPSAIARRGQADAVDGDRVALAAARRRATWTPRAARRRPWRRRR